MSAKARVWFSVTSQGKPKFVQTQRKHFKDVLISILLHSLRWELCGGWYLHWHKNHLAGTKYRSWRSPNSWWTWWNISQIKSYNFFTELVWPKQINERVNILCTFLWRYGEAICSQISVILVLAYWKTPQLANIAILSSQRSSWLDLKWAIEMTK